MSGFFGDRLSAAREMIEGGPIDVLTGDYLAELTMTILAKQRDRDARLGYASTFLSQLEEIAVPAAQRGIRIVVNAGGLNPGGLATAARDLLARLGVRAAVAHIEGDDLIPRLDALRAAGHRFHHLETGRDLGEARIVVNTANVYLGGWGIATALRQGADIVICPRVADAALVVGAAAWHFSWPKDAWNELAGAVVAGHLIECGPQVTGGNYSFFEEVPGLAHLGFPLAEIRADGTSVITKHPNHGGTVTVGTVTAQLLYEIAGPRYVAPDVVARVDSVQLQQVGPDRVLVAGVHGEPAPRRLKVAMTYDAGFRNSMTLVLTGLDIESKAAVAREALFKTLGGEETFGAVDVRLVRGDRPDADSNELATALLCVTVSDPDPRRVGRAFSNAVTALALSSYPGFFTTTPPAPERALTGYWPALVDANVINEEVVLADGRRLPIARAPGVDPLWDDPAAGESVRGPRTMARMPLGTVAGARSGDKGGNANVGVWVRTQPEYEWLAGFLTVDRLRRLLPEADGLEVRRYPLPNLLAINFVIVGLLGEGVSTSLRFDPQAKGLGEFLRSRVVDIPIELIEARRA